MDFNPSQHDSSDVPSLGPFSNLEFPPLSQQRGLEGQTMPSNNPVDQMVLEKSTPVPPGQEDFKVEKDLCQVIPESECMIEFGLKQVRHTNAITLELKLMLEHEQKILQQVMTRIDKFKALRDENKRKSVEWETEYKAKIPEYDSYSMKLVNVPQSKTISVEGVPGPVQQKILFQIVSRTTNTANRVVVQLSMEEAVANDIDLTLGDLKKHCTVMMKQISSWLRMLKSQECHQTIVLERWNECKILLKVIKDKRDQVPEGRTGTVNISNQMKPYEDRLKRIEEAICKLCGPPCGTCQNGGTPGSDSPSSPGTYSPYDPIRGSPDCPGSPGAPPSPCPPSPCPPSPCPPSPRPLSPCPPLPSGSGVDGYLENPFLSPPAPVEVPVCPDDVFGTPRTPPPDWSLPPDPCSPNVEPVECDNLGLQRNRAPPGMFPDIELVDTPGMGFPVPQAALERGGRPRGQIIPLSPTSPPPRQMGRFRPVAASSPARRNLGISRQHEMPPCLPPNPMAGQPMDPALLPKIQEDLQKLAERNRKLKDLVTNFTCIRSTLTDEIDKAVRLNQKLQRDLYYLAEAHK